MSAIPRSNTDARLRRVLLISHSETRVEAALFEKRGTTWQRQQQVEARAVWPRSLTTVLADIPNANGTPVVLVTDVCLPVLHPQEVPVGLKAGEVNEMLRWETAALLDGMESDHRAADSATNSEPWQVGHCAAGRQTVVAGVRGDFLAEVRSLLSPYGLNLHCILPAAILGWQSLQEDSARGAAALLHCSPSLHMLSILENGQCQFLAAFPAVGPELSRMLLADLRSFAPVRILSSGSVQPAGLSTAPQQLPEDGLWHAALTAAGLQPATPGTQAVPGIACRLPEAPLWLRPRLWWAAAAALILGIATPTVLGWARELTQQRQTLERLQDQVQQTQTQLAAYEADAREFSALESQLAQLKVKLDRVTADNARPGMAACAQVSYSRDALRALSMALSHRLRLESYHQDYEGHVQLKGEVIQDASIQDAIGSFYANLERYPLLPSRISTTREGATLGRLRFTAENTAPVASGTVTTPSIAEMNAAALPADSLTQASVPSALQTAPASAPEPPASPTPVSTP